MPTVKPGQSDDSGHEKILQDTLNAVDRAIESAKNTDKLPVPAQFGLLGGGIEMLIGTGICIACAPAIASGVFIVAIVGGSSAIGLSAGVLGAKARFGLIREEMTTRRLEIEAQTAEARIRLANQEAQLAKAQIEKIRLEAHEAEARAAKNRAELLEVQSENALMMERMESRRIDEEIKAKYGQLQTTSDSTTQKRISS